MIVPKNEHNGTIFILYTPELLEHLSAKEGVNGTWNMSAKYVCLSGVTKKNIFLFFYFFILFLSLYEYTYLFIYVPKRLLLLYREIEVCSQKISGTFSCSKMFLKCSVL